jgi:hypothetical protein
LRVASITAWAVTIAGGDLSEVHQELKEKLLGLLPEAVDVAG